MAEREELPAVFRGTVVHFLRDPGPDSAPDAWELFEDGALAIAADGTVAWARGLRMTCGKVLMDRRPDAPEFLWA
ncbi:hypothetical protein [Nocardia brasiliensis]